MRKKNVSTRTLLSATAIAGPSQVARSLGLYPLDRVAPLRRAMMRDGVAPRNAEPRLMRGEAL
jgi:2-octaprenyl-6-methoxyphenol hydroxylase